MKKIILSLLFLTFAPKAFSQMQVTVNCKLTSSYEISAVYDTAKKTLLVTQKQNGEVGQYSGVSFQQLNKTSLNKNTSLLALAKSVSINLSLVNSANIFTLTQDRSQSIELVDFISIDGESLGTVQSTSYHSAMLCVN